MPGNAPPASAKIYRIVHKGCLRTLLTRGVLFAPNFTPNDGLPYRTIHNEGVQANRRLANVTCGPCGTIHDYVPFYFGPLSVMLLNLKTGRVPGYEEGQEPIVYLTTTVERVVEAGLQFVFSDGHGLAGITEWFDNVDDLANVDWSIVGARYWADTPADNDRQRRKQAEFLVHSGLPWDLVTEIGVFSQAVENQINRLLEEFPARVHPIVRIKKDWYYY